MNILFVENHATFARIATERFFAGDCVTVVGSVEAAIAALSRESFEVVLVDYDLDDQVTECESTAEHEQ